MSGYYESMRTDDAVLTLENGIQVKRSNYEGVEVGGRRLFYRASPHISLDPWTRGAVEADDVIVLARLNEEDSFPLVVYITLGDRQSSGR